MLLFLFDQEYAGSAEDEEHTGYDEHTGLYVRAYIFKEKSSAQGCYDLRNTDGAVEKAEVITHIAALDGIRHDGERQGQHSRPSSADEGVTEPEHIGIMHKEDGDESDSAYEQRDGICALVARPMLELRQQRSP